MCSQPPPSSPCSAPLRCWCEAVGAIDRPGGAKREPPVDEPGAAPAVRRDAMVAAFNFLPSTYCQPSWLPAGLDAWREDERRDAAHPAHRHVSPWLLARHRLSCEYELSCEDPRVRLALLDAPALTQLSWALGLLGCQSMLRRTV